MLNNYRILCLSLSFIFVCFSVSCNGGGATNPNPILSSLSPSAQDMGGPSFTLTAIGSNFVTSSIVQWNGSDRPTHFIDNTQLNADIFASDITSAGTATVRVFNPSPGGGFSNSVNFTIRIPAPVISKLSPANRTMGGPDFTLSVDGSNFLSSSIIRWDGFDCPTTFVSNTRLTTTITAQAVATAGTAQVVVHNPLTDGGDSRTVVFAVDKNIDGWTYLGGPTINGTSYTGVEQIVVDPQDQQILYVTVYRTGLFTSRDGGVSWTNAVSGTSAGCIAPDPNTVNRVFYGQRNLLYATTDRGLSWNLQATLNSGVYFTSMIVSRIDPHRIYAGLSDANGVFYRSLDDGKTWESYSFGETVGLDNFIPWTIAEDPVDGTLYVGVELGKHPDPYHPPFLRSTDGGVTWTNIVESVTSSNLGPTWHVVKAVVHPTNHVLYALTEGPGLYISEDHGSTWTRWASEPECELLMDQNWIDRLFGGEVFYSNMPGGTFVSTSGGRGFLPFGLGGLTACSLATTGNSSHLYAAAYGSGIYVTPLPAPSPIPEPIPPPPVLISPKSDDVLPQPYDGWTFEWQDVPGAQDYQIYIIHTGSAIPVVNSKTIATHYRHIQEGSYIGGGNLTDWTWKVRAQNGDGIWGPWSETRTFSVAPQ